MSDEQANLGLATTAELLTELQARALIGGYDHYRTVDGYDALESPIVFMRGGGSHPPTVSDEAEQVPADTITTIEREAEMILTLATGPWGRGEFTGEPSRLTVQVRHERFAQHAANILAALATVRTPD